MRLAFKLLFLLPLLLIAVAAASLFLAVDDQPLVAQKAEIRPENIERARRIIERNDPRKMKAGVLRSIAVPGEDLDLALNYVAGRYARASTSVVLGDGSAALRATVRLPNNPLGAYFNVDAALRQTSGLPRFESLRIGSLPVPVVLANWALGRAFAHLQERAGIDAALDSIKSVKTAAGMLHVVYDWNDALPEKLRSILVPPAEIERLRAYQARLGEAVAAAGAVQSLPLEALARSLLQLAAQRSATGEAALENRAAIVVLAFYVNGKGLGALIPSARDWPGPAARNVILGGRHDFAQHFSISAAIAAASGSPLADAIGLYKEIDDSRGGSGFSFNDIAADRSGTRFGELAVRSGGAARVQKAGAGLLATDIFPEVKDLPEFMQESEFKRRFGGIGAPAYRKMVAEIEQRIAALPLYR
ncbi:MAG: hypothetical protein ACKVQQ_06205 [Burkholderiales bacterium]